jgi:hypothetical protein
VVVSVDNRTKDGVCYAEKTVVKIYHSFLQPNRDLSDYVGLVSSNSKKAALAQAQRRGQGREQRRRQRRQQR